MQTHGTMILWSVCHLLLVVAGDDDSSPFKSSLIIKRISLLCLPNQSELLVGHWVASFFFTFDFDCSSPL